MRKDNVMKNISNDFDKELVRRPAVSLCSLIRNETSQEKKVSRKMG